MNGAPLDQEKLSTRLGSTLNAIREGIQIVGFDWRYLYVNDALCRHGRRNRDELLGFTMSEAYPGFETTPVFPALRRCMTDRLPFELENEFTYPDGAHAWFELRIEPCPDGIFVLSVDVTERKRLEIQLRHAQKMDAVGKLAGGVAHDFNNLLTGIKSFTEFAVEGLPALHPVLRDLHEVLQAADRATELTRQLLTFGRRQAIQPRVVDLGEVVGSVRNLLGRLLGEDIDIVTRFAAPAWRTLIDPGAFEQVLVNLSVNARDAMPNGGRLTLETTNVGVDEAQQTRQGRIMPPGDYVLLAVSDEGAGMDAATQEHIFEPFFTTKEIGKGTGLGLSICWGIVKQAGGHIWVYSEVGRGSTFKIYLPRVLAETESFQPPAVEKGKPGHESVLVVEDDPQVRQVAARALAGLGYAVRVASGAAEALALVAAEDQPLDLLLTDVVMPETTGRELALQLLARWPRLRVLYMTGYTETAVVDRGVLDPGAPIITKPFSPTGLARRVREVLDGPGAPSPTDPPDQSSR